MRSTALAAGLVAASATVASADTFGGFSGVDRPYLVNSDRVCVPLVVENHAATGAPKCETAPADVIAKQSFKPPIIQSGAHASFAATASGTTLAVTRRTGEALLEWSAPDPIGKIVEVYGSQYDDRVAVAFTVRRLGKEVTDIVAFDLGQAHTAVIGHVDPTTAKPPVVTPPPVADDPKVVKAVAAAKAAPKAKAIAAWRSVLALDGAHAEALYQIAALQLGGKQPAAALESLGALVGSAKSDAVEWLVEARFDAAFASLRADPKFRAIVGLDKPASTTYERLMGFGGQWEQTGTSCDKPEVHLVALRNRTVNLRVKTACEGQVFNTPFKGVWRIEGDDLVLTFAHKGQKVTADDEAPCHFEPSGDENALRCVVGRDLDFALLPTRR